MEVRVDPLFQSSGDLLADRRYGVAVELAARGDRPGAIDVLMQAIELAPDFAFAWFALADLREVSSDRSGAVEAFRRAQAADPVDRHGAGLRLARLNAQVPDAMPAGYVRALFDQYAPRFDSSLEALSYRGPALLLDAIRRWRTQRGQRLRFGTVLDLGCGTGLMGALVRPVCDWLVGVDLSPGMIANARQKRLYDRLDVADIGQFMKAQCNASSRYHLILAADVLPYIGEFAEIIAQAKSLLDAGGLFCFTVETQTDAAITLGDKLRYAHSEAYVQSAVVSAGLAPFLLEYLSIRTEGGAPVAGLIAVVGHS